MRGSVPGHGRWVGPAGVAAGLLLAGLGASVALADCFQAERGFHSGQVVYFQSGFNRCAPDGQWIRQGLQRTAPGSTACRYSGVDFSAGEVANFNALWQRCETNGRWRTLPPGGITCNSRQVQFQEGDRLCINHRTYVCGRYGLWRSVPDQPCR